MARLRRYIGNATDRLYERLSSEVEMSPCMVIVFAAVNHDDSVANMSQWWDLLKRAEDQTLMDAKSCLQIIQIWNRGEQASQLCQDGVNNIRDELGVRKARKEGRIP